MSQFNEVAEPIICDAYAEPPHHWVIEKGKPPHKAPGRREACYYYRPPGRSTGTAQADEIGTRIPLDLVNQIRRRLKAWRQAGYPGATAMTSELLAYWNPEDQCQRGRSSPLGRCGQRRRFTRAMGLPYGQVPN